MARIGRKENGGFGQLACQRWCIAAAASRYAEYLERSPFTYDEQIGVA